MLNRTVLRQLIVFGLVGVTATATHYLVALLSHEGAGINLYVSNMAGYCTAVAVSYVGHGVLTFQTRLTRHVFKRFIVVSMGTFLTTEGILAVLEEQFGLAHRVSLAIVVLTVPIITFILSKLWVYRDPATSSAE
jgi:putative flippase GtrA